MIAVVNRGDISYKFEIPNGIITEGIVVNRGVWDWHQSDEDKAKFEGFVPAGSVALPNTTDGKDHVGKFRGSYIRVGKSKGGGNGTKKPLTWKAQLIGVAGDKCSHGIATVVHSTSFSTGYGYGVELVGTTCGHDGSEWGGDFIVTIRDSSSGKTVINKPSIKKPVIIGKQWESSRLYFYNPLPGQSTRASGGLIVGVDVAINFTYTVSCVIEGKKCIKKHNAKVSLP